MNKLRSKQPLIAVALLALVGAVGAQTYYTHQLVRRVEADEAPTPAISMVDPAQAPAAAPADPWSAMHADMRQMEARIDQMFHHAFAGHSTTTPGAGQVTLQEQGNDYLVTADIPGAKKGDIDVHLDGRLLSISSQVKGQEQQSADNGQVTRQERYSSSFQQAFTLPGPVDAAKMHTQFQDGVLKVTIPKATS